MNVTSIVVNQRFGWGAIERILDDYDLLVVDMISSRVVSMALRLEIPIIIFLPEGNVVNEHCFADLKIELT